MRPYRLGRCWVITLRHMHRAGLLCIPVLTGQANSSLVSVAVSVADYVVFLPAADPFVVTTASVWSAEWPCTVGVADTQKRAMRGVPADGVRASLSNAIEPVNPFGYHHHWNTGSPIF